jgi:hypothetical protein
MNDGIILIPSFSRSNLPIAQCPHNAQCFDFNLFFFFSYIYALSPVSGDKRESTMRIEPHPLSLTGRKIMSCEEWGGGEPSAKCQPGVQN